MKTIAYLSYTHFADCDIPLLHELQHLEPGLIYILQLTEKDKNRTIINVNKLKKKGGLFPATDYPELLKLSKFIRLDRTYILNMPGLHDFSPSNILAVLRLRKFLRQQNCSLIHFTWPLRYGAFPLYTLHNRMLLTVHDPLPHSSETGWLNRFHRKVAIRLVPHFLLLNRVQLPVFIAHHKLNENQVFCSRLSIYNHLESTTPILPSNSDYILFIGSISSHKGVDVLCEAMMKVCKQLPNQKLVVAGSGKLYFNIAPYQEAGFLELHNHYLSDEELKGYILQSRFVVCPYIDATQSGVIMSAFALGKPVIATNVGALPEMVENGRHGLIVPPRDSEALAQAIIQLSTSASTRLQMQQNILEDYHEGLRSWHQIAQDISSIYHKLSAPQP